MSQTGWFQPSFQDGSVFGHTRCPPINGWVIFVGLYCAWLSENIHTGRLPGAEGVLMRHTASTFRLFCPKGTFNLEPAIYRRVLRLPHPASPSRRDG